MKYFLFLFAVYSFSAVFTSCGTSDIKHTENTVSKRIDYLPVKNGVLHGAGEEGISQGVVGISSIEDYNELRNKMNSVNEELEEDIIADERFFDEEMLIFVFDKVRGTGGYTFEVEEITENNEVLQVKAISKPPSDPATSVMTQPYQIVSINKSDKELSLEVIE